MKQIIIKGNKKLEGEIIINGAKNSAVALIPTAILCDEEATIYNIPNISDVDALDEILEYLGAKITKENNKLIIDSSNIKNKEIPENIAKKLRASYYFMGALLGKYKKVKMHFPGGCNIGSRPINLHLKAFEALGAKIIEKEDSYTITAKKLKGAKIYFDIASVGATINTMLAAVKAEGTTTIQNAAKEPEIVNVAIFLNNMGAKIIGAGTSEIKIIGVKKLKKSFVEVIPDRIEAGTYIILSALIGKKIKISNIIPEHISALISKLKESQANIEVFDDYLIIKESKKLKAVNIKTAVFPGFPTDLQQIFATFLTQCNGKGIIHETIYENRFQNIEYLNKMGSKIEIKKDKLYIEGPTKLIGEEVEATDLRGGASLIVAALIANKTTTINNVEHILRGYSKIVENLKNIGANIKTVDF